MTKPKAVIRRCEICLSGNEVRAVGGGEKYSRPIRLCLGCRRDNHDLDARYPATPPPGAAGQAGQPDERQPH